MKKSTRVIFTNSKVFELRNLYLECRNILLVRLWSFKYWLKRCDISSRFKFTFKCYFFFSICKSQYFHKLQSTARNMFRFFSEDLFFFGPDLSVDVYRDIQTWFSSCLYIFEYLKNYIFIVSSLRTEMTKFYLLCKICGLTSIIFFNRHLFFPIYFFSETVAYDNTCLKETGFLG